MDKLKVSRKDKVVRACTKSDPIRICMIYPGHLCPSGGAQRLTFDLAKSLSKENEVAVVCFSFGFFQQGLYENKNLLILPILEKKRFRLLRNSFSIFKLLIKEHFDVINVAYAYRGVILAIVGKLFGIPIIVTSLGGDILKDYESGYGLRLNRKIAAVMWLILKLVDVHVVVSKSMIKDAIETGSSPSKIEVVYNGIDFENIPSTYRTDIFKRYELSYDDFIVLFLGRLVPWKCPEDLVKGFLRVKQEIPNAKLVIAGKGEEEKKLKQLVYDLNLDGSVIFLGFVSEDEKWDLFKRCDVFTLPSSVEAFGLTLVEAMACSKPVIATNMGPFPEIISNGRTGLLVPLHSPDELAEAIITLAKDEKLKIKMGNAARRVVEKRFDIKRTAQGYLKIFKHILNK